MLDTLIFRLLGVILVVLLATADWFLLTTPSYLSGGMLVLLLTAYVLVHVTGLLVAVQMLIDP